MPIDYIFVFLLSFTTVVFVILRALQEDNKKRGGGNDGGDFDQSDLPPKIDLPPGVCWPDEVKKKDSVLI